MHMAKYLKKILYRIFIQPKLKKKYVNMHFDFNN
jgi:hypothetical protein